MTARKNLVFTQQLHRCNEHKEAKKKRKTTTTTVRFYYEATGYRVENFITK